MRKLDGSRWHEVREHVRRAHTVGGGVHRADRIGGCRTRPTSGTPIKIGLLETNAGPGDINEGDAFTATVKYINAHGGVRGHPIQLTVDLEANDVATSVANAQKFISQGYDAIVDGDANDKAWAPSVEAAEHPGPLVGRHACIREQATMASGRRRRQRSPRPWR